MESKNVKQPKEAPVINPNPLYDSKDVQYIDLSSEEEEVLDDYVEEDDHVHSTAGSKYKPEEEKSKINASYFCRNTQRIVKTD